MYLGSLDPCFDDLWALDSELLEWTAVQSREGGSPAAADAAPPDPSGPKSAEEGRPHVLPPCAGHRLVVWGGSLLCIGGHVKVLAPSLSLV